MLEPSELFPEVQNLYEFLSVHAGMLFDDERVGRYSDAINRSVRRGDVVVDIGTGTGLLAFLCLRAGAQRVHAIERSPALKWAKLLADQHGFSGQIVFHKGDSRRLELPERVDLVVSELIGHIAFEEGMVESLFDARDRFLRPGGSIIPQRVILKVALVSEQNVYAECVDCWQPRHGIDYSPLRYEAVKACYLTTLRDHDLLSESIPFFSVDFCGSARPELRATHVLTACRSGILNGIGLWFDASLAQGVALSSAPWTRTHWQQCFMPIADPIEVAADERITVELEMNLRSPTHESFSFGLRLAKET